MKIQEYIEQVHQTATEHGWHEQKQSTEHWLMLIITEICEMIEADRENNHARREMFEHRLEVQPNDPDDRFKEWFKPYIKDTFEDELADIRPDRRIWHQYQAVRQNPHPVQSRLLQARTSQAVFRHYWCDC